MEGLPQDFVIQYIYSYCKRPSYKRYQDSYNAECCICHEGSSSGRKKRLFYFLKDRYFYCFNCSRSWSELNWIKEVTGKPVHEILREAGQFVPGIESKKKVQEIQATREVPTIPYDSIDIMCDNQMFFYKEEPIVSKAYEYAKNRRLFTAVNKPKSLFVSLDDYVHKNRLIIPFYNQDGKVGSYQSRVLDGNEFPKYLTKYGEKCLYGENSIDNDIPYIFVFEGPIDAMFVRNGVAMGGPTMTERQESFIKTCISHQVIYVYDNDKDNKEMDKIIKLALKDNKRLFIWPKELSKYKDINEICCKLQIDEFPYKFIVQNSYTGVEGLMKLKL